MKTGNLALSLGLLGALAGAPVAQERTAPPTRSLIEKLGDDQYRTRRDAEEALGELGRPALEALREAAENHEDEEVRWRARRLIQRIEEGRSGLRQRDPGENQRPQEPLRGRLLIPGGRLNFGSRDLDEMFERLFGQLEREFDMDIPRGRFFADDFFKDLEGQMDDVRRRMEDRTRGQVFGPGWNFDSSSQGVSVQIGPDGVKLEVQKKNEDGETETETYEAPDMETFREKYPEIADQYMSGGRGSFRSFFSPGGARSFGPSGARSFGIDPGVIQWLDIERDPTTPGLRQRGPGAPGPRLRTRGNAPRELEVVPDTAIELAAPPDGQRLGVMVRALDEGLGLLVDEVEEDSLAQDLGVRAGDIITRIGEVEIRGVENVREALGAIVAGETVDVVVTREGENIELEATKRKTAETVRIR